MASSDAVRISGDEPIIPLYGYQKRWVSDKSRLKIGLWSRQSGKSFSTSLEAVIDCFEKKTDWVFLSAGERQSKELIRKAKMHVEAMNIAFEDANNDFLGENGTVYKQLEIIFPNGSRILALPANPDTARGHSANVVLDEFAFHQDSRKIWSALFPTITRGFKLRVISTPQGRKNKFYELWSGNPKYSKHLVDIYRAVEEGLQIIGEDGQLTGPEFLREGLDDEEAWHQEYECQFVDEATAYITYELISAAECETIGMEDNVRRGGQIFAGIDIGRKRDLTVYWSFELVGDVFWTLRIVEMQGETFNAQLNRILALVAEDAPHRICVDASGIGAKLAEDLQRILGTHRVEAIEFRNAVKEDLAINTKRKFEDRLIRIPVERRIREDIHNIKKVVTAAGNIRFDAERTKDGHSDRFWALALGLHAGSRLVMPVEIVVGRPRETGLILARY